MVAIFKQFLAGIGFLFLFLFQIQAVPVESWETSEKPNFVKKIKMPRINIANAIFDEIEDLELYKREFDKSAIGFEMNRRVFDNHDVVGSWTVVDATQIKGRVILSTWYFSPFTVHLGSHAGIKHLKIHQILPDQYSSLPSLEEQKQEAKSYEVKLKDYLHTEEQDKDFTWNLLMKPDGTPRLFFIKNTTENKAKYSGFLSKPFLPFKLPLTVQKFKAMKEGEIQAYVLSGLLELGGGIGWTFGPADILVGRAGVSLTTYLRTQYQITIFKENEHLAKVKVTLLGGWGHGGSASTSETPNLFEGILAFKSVKFITKLDDELKIIPFQFQVNHETLKQFNVVYRYDLQKAQAQEAYERAVQGRFSLSEELSFDENGSPMSFEETGVMRTASRSATIEQRITDQRMRLTLLFKKHHTTSQDLVDAVITLPDGTHKFFSSHVNNSKKWKTIWGAYEEKNFNFSTNVDLDRYPHEQDALNAFTLSGEGTIEDSNTSEKELLNYILETENTVGQAGLFPRFPEKSKKNNRYGRSRIFYRININQQQLEKFLNTPRDKMWALLEKVFGPPGPLWSHKALRTFHGIVSGLFVMSSLPFEVTGFHLKEANKIFNAHEIYNRWVKAQKQTNLKKKVEALGRLFYARHYSAELLQLLRLVLEGEKVDFLVSGYSLAFGTVWEEGKTELQFEDLGRKYQNELEFDREGPRTLNNPLESQIQNIQLMLLSERHLKLSFTLPKKPKALYLEVETVGRFILLNRENLLEEGANELLLSATDRESLWTPIAEQLKPGKRYNVRLAVNVNNINWGQPIVLPLRVLEFEVIPLAQ